MTNILATVMLAICACHLIRWGYIAIVKRQRIDWAVEREHFKRHLHLMLRVMRTLIRAYHRGWRLGKRGTHMGSGRSSH